MIKARCFLFKKLSHQKRIFKAAKISGEKLKNMEALEAESKFANKVGGGGSRRTSAALRLDRKFVSKVSLETKVDNIEESAAEHRKEFILREKASKKKASDRLADRLMART